VEHAEWLQLQKDLQVAVIVANDFRTEAQQSFGAVMAENDSLRDKVGALTKELAVLRQQLAASGNCVCCLDIACDNCDVTRQALISRWYTLLIATVYISYTHLQYIHIILSSSTYTNIIYV